jgi:hypothetical protein
MRAEKVFETIKGKDWAEAGPTLAKNYLHAQRLVGADKLVIPTATSTPEEIAAFRTKMGVPAKFEEYSYGKLPEGMAETQLDKARLDAWRKEMHEAGLPKAQADRLLNKYITEEFGTFQARNKFHTDALATNELAVKAEFGDKYDENVNFAQFAAKQFGDEALLKLLDESGMGSHPAVVRFFAKAGRAMADDKARGGGGGGASSPEHMTPGQAQAELVSFESNKANIDALHDKNNPAHDRAVKERMKLYTAAFPPSGE